MSFIRPALRPLAHRPLLRYPQPSLPRTPFPRTRHHGNFRSQSTSSTSSAPGSARNFVVGSALAAGTFLAYLSLTDSRNSFHQYVVIPAVRFLYKDDPEGAHRASLESLRLLYSMGLYLRDRGGERGLEGLQTELFGQTIPAPIAVSAGLDKHGECIDPLFALSPALSILEVGCVTPLPQEGNPQPRLFRLTTSEGMINRYGFNSIGADAVAVKLRKRVLDYAIKNGLTEQDVLDGKPSEKDASLVQTLPASLHPGKLLAVQIGKNKVTPAEDMEAVKRDYLTCVDKLGRYADFLVVNVSSPNTPGLRSLQKFDTLSELLAAVVYRAGSVNRRVTPPVVVKVSPDSDSDEDIRGVCMAIMAAGVKGVIVANTTTARPAYIRSSPKTPAEEIRIADEEMGGYSGPGLKEKMLDLVGRYRRELDGLGGKEVLVFASGGITDGKDAYEAMKRGAAVVMGYTSMVYKGVGWAGRVGREMAKLKAEEGK